MEKKCKHCAMMVPKDAKICPYCRKRLTTSLITKAVAAFFILMFISMVFGNKSSTQTPQQTPEQQQSKKEGDDKYWAAYAAKELVSKTLKAPGSAEWPDISEFETLPVAGKKNTWRVNGYVDATNSYGAKLRTTFNTTIRKDPNGDMVLVSIKTKP